MIGFTCCVNYADMLKLTWPHNKKFFGDFIVVTSSDDLATQEYCRESGIRTIISDSYKQDGSTFNRAAMLNKAIDVCAVEYPEEWLVSMDSDVIMDMVDDNRKIISDPWLHYGQSFTPAIFGSDLDKKLIYGCPRKMIREQCEVTLDNLRDPGRGEWFRYPYYHCAYLGYFQMFFKKSARNDESYKNVNNSDTAFLDKNFGIGRARTLRNLVAYHLGENEVNWNGRVSKEWK